MLGNIVAHSLEVTRVALFLTAELNKKGQNIDLHLVEAASLLHDISKTACLRTSEDHTQAGYRLLQEIGYEKVGKVVAQHVWLTGERDPATVSEEEVVNYADKRVRHNQIVSLGERFQDLKDRYGKSERSVRYLEELERMIFGIENKIFLILRINPDDIQILV